MEDLLVPSRPACSWMLWAGYLYCYDLNPDLTPTSWHQLNAMNGQHLWKPCCHCSTESWTTFFELSGLLTHINNQVPNNSWRYIFLLAPPWRLKTCLVFKKCLDNYWMNGHNIGWKHSECSMDDRYWLLIHATFSISFPIQNIAI